MKKYITFIIFLVCVGCSSLQTSLNSAQIPAERLLKNQTVDISNPSEIIVLRDRSISGSSCYYAIYINDELSARIAPSEKAVFQVRAGNINLKITRDPQGEGLCSSGDDQTQETLIIKNSEKKYFRLSMSLSGWPELHVLKNPGENQ